MALALRPKVLIADEPTTALDVTIQQQIITLVRTLQEHMGMAVVWVTHDLGVVARVAERTMVMYGGHIVEVGPTARVFRRPEHPYTAGLLAAIPPVRGAERPRCGRSRVHRPSPAGRPPAARSLPAVPNAIEQCGVEMPPLTDRGRQRGRLLGPAGAVDRPTGMTTTGTTTIGEAVATPRSCGEGSHQAVPGAGRADVGRSRRRVARA